MKRLLVVPLALLAVSAGGAVRVAQDVCGPFTDVPAAICPYVLEMYYLGITAGTSPTTYSPNNPVTRGQAAVFVSKGVNQALARSSPRAALGRWWTTSPHYDVGIGVTDGAYGALACDGPDIWIQAVGGGVHRIRASDGRVLETWPGVANARALISAMGRIFIAFGLNPEDPGQLYMIDPSQPPGTAVLVSDDLGAKPASLAYDGEKLWTANEDGSISLIQPGSSLPWTSTTLTPGITSGRSIVFDGSNIWASDPPVGKIHKMDSAGAIITSYTVGDGTGTLLFDGQNLWVTTCCGVSVLRRSDGASLAFLQDPLLPSPSFLAFDGQRVLVLNGNSDGAALWNAATLEKIVSTSLGTGSLPQGAASDGIDFWISLGDLRLARF